MVKCNSQNLLFFRVSPFSTISSISDKRDSRILLNKWNWRKFCLILLKVRRSVLVSQWETIKKSMKCYSKSDFHLQLLTPFITWSCVVCYWSHWDKLHNFGPSKFWKPSILNFKIMMWKETSSLVKSLTRPRAISIIFTFTKQLESKSKNKILEKFNN